MLALLSPNEIVICILLIAFLCGGLIFFLAGVMRVKNGTVVIVEKIGLYHTTLTKGLYYFMPLAYRRVATYPTSVLKKINISEKTIEINISITDFKIYHYSSRKIQDILEELSTIKYNSINEYIVDLSQKLLEVSCVLKKRGD